jgi:hypothetical protein
MENLSIKNTHSAISYNLIRVGDLVHFEGSLLTLFEDVKNGHLYIFDWVDRSSISNRWLVYRISPSALLGFINHQIPHLDLFKSNSDGKSYVTDIETKHRITVYNLSELDEVPAKYFPNKEHYFDKADSPHLEKIRAAAMKALSSKKPNNEYLLTKKIF